jgi:N-acetylneuraminate lyase
MTEFSGIWPALVTPFTTTNEIHTDTIVRMVEHNLEKGVNGFYVCGGTGSGVFLSVAERKLVAETVLDTVQGHVPVIIHVGAVALPDAITLAQHAQQHGAAGISSIMPPFFETAESIVAYYTALAGAVPELSFFPYIVRPAINGLALMRRLMTLPNLGGCKYTGPNMFEFSTITTLRDTGWSVFSGMDEQSVFAAMSGSCGHIGSTLNYMPGVYAAIRRHLAAGDHSAALDLQQRGNAVTRVMVAGNFFGALYEVMCMLGFDCGNPRLPHLPLSVDEKDRLHTDLEAAGFWEMVAVQ